MTRKLWKTPRNLLILQDCCGIELVFPELEGIEDPYVGDEATIDSKPAEGEFLMPDGTLLVFEEGEIIEVFEPSEESLAFANQLMNHNKNKSRSLWKQRK